MPPSCETTEDEMFGIALRSLGEEVQIYYKPFLNCYLSWNFLIVSCSLIVVGGGHFKAKMRLTPLLCV